MEIALQLIGKWCIVLKQTQYSSTYYVASLMLQTFREGTVYFGLQALTI